MKKSIIFLVITVLFCSCGDFLLNEDYRGGDWFYLENNGAVMPIMVNGNKQSNKFILFLHGGPGESAIMYRNLFNVFKLLEKDYAIVYWDQRMSMSSQGNAKPDSLTMKQFVEDLGKVVALIRYKYNNPALFLMGHSWGGALGTAFLINPINQINISGWIEINGGHNLIGAFQLSKEWIISKAEEQIVLGKDVDFWRKEIAWYISNPNLTNVTNYERHGNNVNKLNGTFFDPSKAPSQGEQSSLVFNSPFNISALLNPYYLRNNIIDWLWTLNFTTEMNKIKIPSLILWGKHDGSTPVAQAQEAYDIIGSDKKYLHIFEHSAHFPFVEEPALFVKTVKEFIQNIK